MAMRSNYDIEEDLPTHIVLNDCGPWDQYLTITNDAEGVIADLKHTGRLAAGKRVFYYDSEGDFSELIIKDGKFAGFGPADARKLS